MLTVIKKFFKVILFFNFGIAHFAGAAIQEPEAVPGEYLVKLKPEMTMNMMLSNWNQALSRSLGAEIKSVLPSAHLLVVQRPAIQTQTSAVEMLAAHPFVEYVEPNYIYHELRRPNDLFYAQQWGLKNNQPKNALDIDAELAWDIETGSGQVIVAIIDSGIDYNNADLKENIWTNEAEAQGKSGVDDDNNGYVDDIYGLNAINGGSPFDDRGHGSHCAGTIGATGNDGQGIAGINWKVKLMGLKFLAANGEGTLESAIRAIDYAVKMGAKVINNSWGAYTSSQALQEAIERSHKAGAIFIAAAGNDGTNNDEKPMFPASHDIPNVISVGASNNSGEMAGFSNWGKKTVHLVAPGVGIYSYWLNGEMKSPSGTSTAAPFVSGVAALVLAHEPQISNIELKERLLRTARPLASFRGRTITGNVLNAFNALKNVQPPPDANDPHNWKSIPLSISTAHPYLPRTKETYEVRVPGAKEISLYFSRFETEQQNDPVKITDKNGKVAHIMSGARGDRYSRIVIGDYAKIEFTSDVETEGYGFDLVKAAYR